MDDILKDLSESALANAIKANLLAFFRYLSRSPHTTYYEDSKLFRWQTLVPHPWFNGVLSTQPASDSEDSTIQNAIAFFKSRNVPVFTWWLEPGLQSIDWGRHLLAHGFRYDTSTPGMAIDLQTLNEDRPASSELRIAPVEDLGALKGWTRTFATGYPIPQAWESDFFHLMAGLGVDLPIRNYTGYLNGQPVATSSLFLAARVAGIMFVATVPEARGRGIGAAMTLAPLREARALGYRAGILQSSEMGFGVYRRLGFRKLCDVDHYHWTTA
jgi:GNAT superfamily N-acetyltransferase